MSLSPNFYNYAQQLINTISNPTFRNIAQDFFNKKQAAGSEDARSILQAIAIAQIDAFDTIDPFGPDNPEPVEVKFFRDNIGFELVQNVTALIQNSTSDSECCTNNTNAITNNTNAINELSIQLKNVTNVTNSNSEDIAIIVNFLDSANITDLNFTKVHRQLHNIDDAIEVLEAQVNSTISCCTDVTTIVDNLGLVANITRNNTDCCEINSANITAVAATVQEIEISVDQLQNITSGLEQFICNTTQKLEYVTECCNNNNAAIETLQDEVRSSARDNGTLSVFDLHRDTFIICAANALFNSSDFTPSSALEADLINYIMADSSACRSVCYYPQSVSCLTILNCILDPQYSPPAVSAPGCSIVECNNSSFVNLNSLGYLGQIFANEVASELCR